jgi:Glycosyltransferase family 9 (heptosyltransferase)
MHILEQYALNCGVKIGKPFIIDKFYPLPCDNYITFNPFGKFESRNYDYWQEVIDIIHPILDKLGIQIVQIGGQNEKPFQKCVYLSGRTNINQTAYIVKNSKLHFGVDSFPIHLASVFGKKIVSLYSNMYSQQSKPYWSNDSDIRLIQAPLNGKKPSYSPQEPDKVINRISPEEICKNILDLLDINEKISTQSLYFGKRYNEKIIETLPDQVINPEFFKECILNIRFDFYKEKTLDLLPTIQNLSTRPCAIILNKPIQLEALEPYKANIPFVIYDVTESIDVNFVKKCFYMGFKLACIFNSQSQQDDSVLNSRKLDLIDYCHLDVYKNIPDNFNKSLLNKDTTKYKTNKILVANHKVYLSKAAYLEDKPIDPNILEQKISDIDNLDILSEDANHIYFFN